MLSTIIFSTGVRVCAVLEFHLRGRRDTWARLREHKRAIDIISVVGSQKMQESHIRSVDEAGPVEGLGVLAKL